MAEPIPVPPEQRRWTVFEVMVARAEVLHPGFNPYGFMYAERIGDIELRLAKCYPERE